mmetsp:Transcript_29907/g.46911  ORF Transcript_29907/g.46911 Transcript_29907/m.46911 type:complete len:82 (+) Transcript_29907:347-592(+)
MKGGNEEGEEAGHGAERVGGGNPGRAEEQRRGRRVKERSWQEGERDRCWRGIGKGDWDRAGERQEAREGGGSGSGAGGAPP